MPLDLYGSMSQADPEPNGYADIDILLRSDTCTHSAGEDRSGSNPSCIARH